MKANRWVYAIAGVIIMLFAGLIYAWSIFSGPIKLEFSTWTSAQLSLTFTICMTCFCLGSLIAGLVSKKVNVKVNIYIAAVLFLLGFFIASKTTSLMMLYIGYGVLCGLASGLTYNSVMSTMSKWFPERQGLISGILLMGFGFGSMIIGSAYTALTPATVKGWHTSFLYLGFILAVILIIGSFFFVEPGEDFVPPSNPKAKKSKNREDGLDLTPGQMIKRPSFILYFLWSTLLSAAGLALISQANPFAQEIGPDINPGTIAFVVGLISICNGVGRVIFGALFDSIGRKLTMLIINVAFLLSIGILILAITTNSFTLVVVGFVCMGFSYGGITPTNSAFTNAFYGPTNYAVNFSIVMLALIFASFGGTIAGALYDASGSYLSTLFLMIGAGGAAFVCYLFIKKP